MTLQFEASMDSPVNLSRSVAALVESWAAGSTWDQVRRDTNLEEGDIARVFRRTAELLVGSGRYACFLVLRASEGALPRR